jgi:excisionase family DNA binding protein
LGVGRSTVYELLAEGTLPSVKIGRARRITRTAIDDFVASLKAV